MGEFCRTMWKRIFQAFGGNDKYMVVMATVAEDPDALRGFEIPANFIVRRKCPQLDVLKVADVFITHGGANSMMESISAHVPMLVLPYVVDQFDNAEIVSRQGIGMHHSDPINADTSHFLATDLQPIVHACTRAFRTPEVQRKQASALKSMFPASRDTRSRKGCQRDALDTTSITSCLRLALADL